MAKIWKSTKNHLQKWVNKKLQKQWDKENNFNLDYLVINDFF